MCMICSFCRSSTSWLSRQRAIRCIFRAAVVVGGLTLAVGAAQGSDLTIANWNVQTLVYPDDPLTVFPGDYRRQPTDFADLRRWRDLVAADVYLLQEVT